MAELALAAVLYVALFVGLQLLSSGRVAGWLVLGIAVSALVAGQVLDMLAVGRGDADLSLRMSVAISAIISSALGAGFARLVLNGRGLSLLVYGTWAVLIGIVVGYAALMAGGMGYGIYYH
jgi:hypothetical protein